MKTVHTEHCCVHHGCKYGEDEYCDVMTKLALQSYPCESCEWENEREKEILKKIQAKEACLVQNPNSKQFDDRTGEKSSEELAYRLRNLEKQVQELYRLYNTLKYEQATTKNTKV